MKQIWKKILAVLMGGVLLNATWAASAAPVRVYDKDIHLQDDNLAGSGWKLIANDPGFYFDDKGNALHKSPSLWSATAKSDPAFSWKYDTGERTVGTSSLSQTYGTGFMFYWMSEFSGYTLDLTNTQYLLMDLYVEDPQVFLNANDYRVDFTDSTDKNNLKWDDSNVGVTRDTLKGQYLKKGWNSLKLYISNADSGANINLKAVTGMRFFAEGLDGTKHTIRLDNVHIVSKGFKMEETQATTTTAKATDKVTTANKRPTTTDIPVAVTTVSVNVASSTTASVAGTGTTASENVEAPTVTMASTGRETSAQSEPMPVINNNKGGGTWIWIVVGAVVLVATGGVALVVILRNKKNKGGKVD